MNDEVLESNIRFSKLYSTLLDIDTSSVEWNDLYNSDKFKAWLKKPEFWLYLWSTSPGSWKTTTAIKLSQYLMSKWYKVLALSLIDYKNHLKRTFGNKNNWQKEFYDYIYRYDFILLDDLSYHVAGEWTNEILKDLFDVAFNKKNPKMIITWQMEIKNLPLPNAIKSRIAWLCHPVHFPELDRRKAIEFNF